MPDRRKHRGPHPEDARLFDADAQPLLRAAAADFCWLLSRGYPHDSALKLVGDRYALVARQRTAVSRCCCSRGRCRCGGKLIKLAPSSCRGDAVAGRLQRVDHDRGGFGRRGDPGRPRRRLPRHGQHARQLPQGGRDVARVGLAGPHAGRLWRGRVPVVARPAGFQQRPAERGSSKRWGRPAAGRGAPSWLPNPDSVLAMAGVAVELPPQPCIVVATADSAILDRCPAWFNLARETIVQHVPDAWVVKMP